MCMGGGAPKQPDIPATIKYAAVKTPTQATKGKGIDLKKRRQKMASKTQVTGPRGLETDAPIQLKALLGGSR